jgi:tRNA threonylcarbamoyl adenosine modification protein YeaZ
MMILAFEFSTAQRSVALARDGMVLAAAVETGGYRVTNAFGLTEKVLAQAKISREEIEVVAVGLGPGSYTGIRAAIAVAQGWQLARGVKLLGVSSADSLAAQAQAAKIFGRVNVVIDAQRGEFYLGALGNFRDGMPGNGTAENSAGGGNCRPRDGGGNLRWAGNETAFVPLGGEDGTTGNGTDGFCAGRKAGASLSACGELC